MAGSASRTSKSPALMASSDLEPFRSLEELRAIFSDKSLRHRFTKKRPNPDLARKSEAWQSFSILAFDGEVVEHVGICNQCSHILRTHASNGTYHGARGLMSHIQECRPATSQPQQKTNASKATAQITANEAKRFRRAMAAFVALGTNDFGIIEKQSFRSAMQFAVEIGASRGYLDVGAVCPSVGSVQQDILDWSNEARQKLKTALQYPATNQQLALTLKLVEAPGCGQVHVAAYYTESHWIVENEESELINVTLGLRQFFAEEDNGASIRMTVQEIITPYGIGDLATIPVITDCEGNIRQALETEQKFDSFSHRLNSCFIKAWTQTVDECVHMRDYDAGAAKLLSYVSNHVVALEHATGEKRIPEVPPDIAKLHQRAEVIDKNYETLKNVLFACNKLRLLLEVDKDLNKAFVAILEDITGVFVQIGTTKLPTLQYPAVTYYALLDICKSPTNEPPAIGVFKQKLRTLLDSKFHPALRMVHWMATYLDPTFKSLEFLPCKTELENKFNLDLRRKIQEDVEVKLQKLVAHDPIPTSLAIIPSIKIEEMQSMESLCMPTLPLERLKGDPFEKFRSLYSVKSATSITTSPSPSDHSDHIIDSIKAELSGYEGAEPVHETNPLAYWKSKRKEFPLLSRLSMAVYSMPAAVPTEKSIVNEGLPASRPLLKTREAMEIIKGAVAARLL